MAFGFPYQTALLFASALPRLRTTKAMMLSGERSHAAKAMAAFTRAISGSAQREAPDVLEFLDSLKNYEKVGVPKGAGTDTEEGFELDRMHRLLSYLGDPHFGYPVIHVAGTKGKGSTAAFLSNILRAEGYSVGLYTSPHVKSIHERIIAGKNDQPIFPASLQKLFMDNWSCIKEAIEIDKGSVTHFELFTALALKYFAEVNVDIAVVEAGLGGARDATNVIPPSRLAVAVITNIGNEHLAALGGSLESIALAKSGIIKQGRPVILGGPLESHLKEIICNVAASKNATTVCAFGEGMQYTIGGIKWETGKVLQQCSIKINRKSDQRKLENGTLQLQMLGRHQLDNALTAICAIMCLQEQGWKVHEKSIWSGLEQTFMPGRFQIIPKSVTMKLIGEHENLNLVFDGAHTASSALVLGRTLSLVFPTQPLAFVIGMASDKDHYNFFSQLIRGHTAKVVVTTETTIAGDKFRSVSATTLAETCYRAAKEHHLDAYLCDPLMAMDSDPRGVLKITWADSVLSALKMASSLLDGKGVICVTGSLHLVSAALSWIEDTTQR